MSTIEHILGPGWTPTYTLRSVLLSVQSLMNKEPYFNEPGYEKRYHDKLQHRESKKYNERIIYETIRVAVLDMVDNGFDAEQMPSALKQIVLNSFKTNYKFYEDLIESKKKFYSKVMEDHMGSSLGKYDYASLLLRLQGLKQKLGLKNVSEGNSSSHQPYSYKKIKTI